MQCLSGGVEDISNIQYVQYTMLVSTKKVFDLWNCPAGG